MTHPRTAIVTTAHWAGDPRLNRHRSYLEVAGHPTDLTSFGDRSRGAALVGAVSAILRSEAGLVILPDPELFLVGGLAARLTGKRPVIDIHEDYPKAAMSRAWVPSPLRPIVRVAARWAIAAGRLVAWRVVVAAPELQRRGDVLVLNIPDPSSFNPAPGVTKNRLVYIGDVTETRGALEMIETISRLDDSFRLLLIGNTDAPTKRLIEDSARALGVSDSVELAGRLEHETAWNEARGSLAGLSLLRPAPAYLEAVATKLWEYMANDIPPIVSNLPGQARLVGQIDPRLVCDSPADAVAIAEELSRNPGLRASMVDAGRRLLQRAWEQNRPDLALQEIVAP